MDDKANLDRDRSLSRRTAVWAIGAGVGGAALATMVGAQQNRPPAVPNAARSSPVNLKDFGAACNGVTNDYAAWTAAIAALAVGYTELLVPGPTVLGSNLVVPSNIRLTIPSGGLIIPSSGATVDIRGPVNAGAYQIFATSAMQAVTLANNYYQDTVYAEWWSYPLGNPAVDVVPYLNRLIDSVRNYVTIRFSIRSTLYFQTTWRILNRVGLVIKAEPAVEEDESTVFAHGASFVGGASRLGESPGFEIINLMGCGHCTIEGFKFRSRAYGVSCTPGGSRISTNNTIRYNRFENADAWAGYVAVSIMGAPNNEFHVVRGNFIVGTNQRGVGIFPGQDGNAHGHIFEDNAFMDLAKGIGVTNVVGQGIQGWTGYVARHNHFTGNLLDIEIGHMSYPTVIDNNGSEGSRQFLLAGNSGGESALTISSNRLAGLGANGVAWIELQGFIGPTTIMANDFQNYNGNNSHLYSVAWDGGGNPGTSLTLIGNYYGNLLNQGMPAANLMVRTGNSGVRLRLPITIIGEPLLAGR